MPVGAVAALAVGGCGRLAPRFREHFRANFFADREAHTEGHFGSRSTCTPSSISQSRSEHSNVATGITAAGLARVRRGRDVTCAIGLPLVNGRCAMDPHPTRSSMR